MAAVKPINRISRFLKESGLSWLLPNIRQDFVVWNALNDAILADKIIQLHPSPTDYRPEEFSPSKLANMALALCDFSKTELLQSLDSKDGQRASLVDINNGMPLLSDALKELATAGSTALTWLDHFNHNNSWNSFLCAVRENNNESWECIIACLYGFLEAPIEFLRELVRSQGSTLLPELAVHAILSNPFTANEQIAILMDLCHEVDGSPAPPSCRLAIIQALSQQRPQLAIDFSMKWLEIEPEVSRVSFRKNINVVEMSTQMLENLFHVELRRYASIGDDQLDFIEDALKDTHNIYSHIFAAYLDQKSKRVGDKKSLDRIFEICDQVAKLNIPGLAKLPPPTSQAELAIALSNHGFYDEAKKLLPSLEETMPDEVQVLFAIARVAYLQGDTANSWKAAAKIVEILDQKPIAPHAVVLGEGFSLTNLAKLLLTLHKYPETARVLELALKSCPNETDLLVMLADCYQAFHHDQKAADTLFALVTLNPSVLEYRRKYARALERLIDWEASLGEWASIIDSQLQEADSIALSDKHEYIHCAIQAKKPDLALQICNEILNLDPYDCQAVIYSGKAYLLLGDVKNGMEFLTRATHIEPGTPETWIALAEAQKNTLEITEVIETLNNAVLAVPNSGEIHFLLGDLYFAEDKPDLALPELQTAVELSPDDVKVLAAVGKVHKRLGNNELCRESYSKAYRLQPGFPGLAHNYAELLLDMGKLEEAIAPLETLVNSTTNAGLSEYLEYARCALILHKQGSPAGSPVKALGALSQALQINPGHAEAKALTAEALTANGDYELAFHAYREALDSQLTQDPEWFERLSFGFGCVANAIGKADIAIAALQEASQVNPENPEIYVALSDAYTAANLPEEAIKAARNVLLIEGENPDKLAWFAAQAAKLGGVIKSEIYNPMASISEDIAAEALAALSKALQLAPSRTDLLTQLGHLQASLGERTEAQITFKSIAALDSATSIDLLSAARYLSEIGDYLSSIACLEKGIALDHCSGDQHDAELYICLAHEYVKNGESSLAIDTLDKALTILPGEGSVILLKVEILLEQGKSLDALNIIEAELQNSLKGNLAKELQFLASHISHSMGDFTGAINYTHMGLSVVAKDSGGNQISQLELPYRVQIAELYRALLQPEQAFQILQIENEITAADFLDERSYWEYVFLQTELALDIGGRIPPNIQDIKLDTSHQSYPRCMAINSRLMNKAGSYKQAEQLYQLAADSLLSNEYLASLPVWSAPITRNLAILSMIEAAQDLGLWDQAMSLSQEIAESYPNEPISSLNIAKTLVLRAEHAHLCEIFEVVNHGLSKTPQTMGSYDVCKQYLDMANALLENYRHYDQLIDGELSNHQVNRWIARARITFNQPTEDKNDLVEILTHQPAPDDIASLIDYFQQSDQNDFTCENLSNSIKLARNFPRNLSVILRVALALQVNNPQDALQSLQFVLEHNPYAKNPYTAFCSVLLAKIGLNLGEYKVAQEAAEKSLSIWPDEPCWHRLAAQIYLRLDDFVHAAQHFRDASRLAPSNIANYLDLGRLLLENAMDDANIYNDARMTFERVLELEPKNLPALISLIDTYYHLHDYDKAEAYGRNALSIAPDQPDLFQLLCKVAIEKNDYQGAYEYANKAVQINPTDVQSNVSLAKSLSSMGRYAEALAKLNTVIPLVGEAKGLHLERVNIIRKISGPQIALNELKSLINIYPNDFSILSALSKLFFEVGELENAVVVAQQALAVEAGNSSPNEKANLHLLIGQILRQTGRLDQSILHLDDAMRLAPNRLEPYLELGLARKEQREYQEALQIFERATLIAPNDPRAPFQAGLALKESKDYKSSETMLRRAVSLAPNDLTIRRQLAAVVALNLIHNPRSARNNVK